MTKKPALALVLSTLTAIAPLACSSAEVSGIVSQTESAALSAGVGTKTSYYDQVKVCVDRGPNACGFSYAASDPTEIMTLVEANKVELTYFEEPDFLFGRGGLAVKEAIALDDETTTALGLPAGTLVQPQFAPLTPDDEGRLVKIALSVGTVLVNPPDPETFEPLQYTKCCDDHKAKICYNCIGGNSGENPKFKGSACCFNSIHFNLDLCD